MSPIFDALLSQRTRPFRDLYGQDILPPPPYLRENLFPEGTPQGGSEYDWLIASYACPAL